MSKRGLLFVISGPSGVGKDTILKQFLQERPDCTLSISATTRAPRPGEEDGVNYYFISREEFGRLVASGEMLEYAEYSGNCYGTLAQAVEKQRCQGKNVILEIEVQGAMQVKKKCMDAVMVFLMPPSMEVLRCRLTGRGTESQEVVCKRMEAARYEISQAGEYDYVIVNNSVEESCGLLDAVVTASQCSIKRTGIHLKEEL